jgi:hypothetical protein
MDHVHHRHVDEYHQKKLDWCQDVEFIFTNDAFFYQNRINRIHEQK